MEVFPTEYACLNKDGFGITQNVSKRYLGTQIYTYPPTMKAQIIIASPAHLAGFGDWWHNKISGGSDPFLVTLNIYPTPKTVVVKFGTDLSFSIAKGLYSMQCELVAQEQIHTSKFNLVEFNPTFLQPVTTNWIFTAAANSSVVDYWLNVVADDTTDFAAAYPIVVEAATQYTVKVDMQMGTATSIDVCVNPDSDLSGIDLNSSTITADTDDLTFIFTSGAAGTIYVGARSTSDNANFQLTNIYVVKG